MTSTIIIRVEETNRFNNEFNRLQQESNRNFSTLQKSLDKMLDSMQEDYNERFKARKRECTSERKVDVRLTLRR